MVIELIFPRIKKGIRKHANYKNIQNEEDTDFTEDVNPLINTI